MGLDDHGDRRNENSSNVDRHISKIRKAVDHGILCKVSSSSVSAVLPKVCEYICFFARSDISN